MDTQYQYLGKRLSIRCPFKTKYLVKMGCDLMEMLCVDNEAGAYYLYLIEYLEFLSCSF